MNQRMCHRRGWKVWLALGALLVMSHRWLFAHEGPPISGKVVDLFCYVQYGGPSDEADKRFGEYKDCVQRNAGANHPLALKIEGDYYLAVDMGFQPMNSRLIPLIGQQITVHGHKLSADGVHVLAIEHLVDEQDTQSKNGK